MNHGFVDFDYSCTDTIDGLILPLVRIDIEFEVRAHANTKCMISRGYSLVVHIFNCKLQVVRSKLFGAEFDLFIVYFIRTRT